MKKIIAIVFSGVLFASTAHANGLQVVVDLSEQALAKGYGNTCNLEMIPVKADGYYPCLDFGPYRYVREYEKIAGYVVQKGKAPFMVFTGTKDNPQFLYEGPWVEDMPEKMIMWWDQNISKPSFEAKKASEIHQGRSAAEEYIKSLNKKDDPAKQMKNEEIKNQPKIEVEEMTNDVKKILQNSQ